MNKNDFWQGKRVFVTGANGFKGSWLSLWLHALGAKVTGFSLANSEGEVNLFSLARIGDVIDHIDGDICCHQILQEAMRESKADVVIHMAAQALVRESYNAPLATYMTNVMGTANVLECVRSCESVKAVVIVTTDKCYENKEWCWGYRENEALGGYDPYSSSKACAELVTAAYRQSFLREAGVAVATVRAGNVVGGGDWAKDRLIPDCLRALARNDVVLVRNPNAIRPWQHVMEPLNGYLNLAEKLYWEGDAWTGSWNFGPPEAACVAVESLVSKLCELIGGQYCVQRCEDGLHEAHYLKLDSSKAGQRLKWSTKLSIAETLTWIAKWHKAYECGSDMRDITLRQIEAYSKL